MVIQLESTWQLLHKWSHALQVQKADAEDAWFQQEWGEIMAQQGRQREAVMHLQVAASLFASHIDKVQY